MIGRIHHRSHQDGLYDVLDSEGRVLVSLLCSHRVQRPLLVVAALVEHFEREGAPMPD